MRKLRAPLTMVLVLLLLFDAFIAVRVYVSGFHVLVQEPDGSFRVRMVFYTAFDRFMLGLLLSIHVGLIYLVRRSWKTPAR